MWTGREGPAAAVGRTVRTAAFLAARSLTRGPIGVLAMTVLMMSLVYVQLLFIPALIQGAIDQAERQLVDTTSGSIQVTPAEGATAIDGAAALVEAVDAAPGVVAATGTLRVGSELAFGSRSGTWPVIAVDPDSYADVFTTPSNLIEGSWLRPGDTDGIVLGVGVAGADIDELSLYRASLRSVHAGDRVTVTFADGSVDELTVVGIYQNRFIASDAQAFVTRAAAAARVPAVADLATAVFARTEPDADVTAVVAGLPEIRDDVTYETWLDQRHAIEEEVSTFDLIKQILRVVSLLVAIVTVAIVTYVDLVGKRRTIGIERAIGIRSSAIVVSYLFKAVAYTALGVVGGLAVLLGVVAPVIDRHPFEFPFGDVRLSISASQLRTDAIVLMVVAVVAALAPAWRSVRIGILDAIWH